MTFLPSKSLSEVVPDFAVEAQLKAGAFAPIVNAMAVEAIANMHRRIETPAKGRVCGVSGAASRGGGGRGGGVQEEI